MSRRGPRPAGSGAREAIAASARRLFGEHGFLGTSLRQIATDAGVDVRLVSHYFGSKADLFVTVTDLPFDPEPAFDSLLAGGREGLGARLAEFILGVLDTPVAQQTMTGLMRATASEEQAARLVRERLLDQLLLPLARRIGTDHAELRASLMSSQVAGLVLTRHIVQLPPLVAADRATLVHAVGPVLDHYLSVPLGPPGVAVPWS